MNSYACFSGLYFLRHWLLGIYLSITCFVACKQQSATPILPAPTIKPAAAVKKPLPKLASVEKPKRTEKVVSPSGELRVAKILSAPKTDADARAAATRPETLVLFTARGPLVVHVSIIVQGQPHQIAVEEALKKAAESAGVALDGSATWDELVAKPNILTGQLGNAVLKTAVERKQVVSQYDANDDGLVQVDEFTALLTQQTSGGRVFQVVSPNESRPEISLDSPVFVLLDEDRDGRLSEDERLAAVKRLRDRDADDNEVVTVADCRRLTINEPSGRRRRTSGPSRAIEMQPWNLDSIYYALYDFFDVGSGLDATSFSLTPRLLEQLDADQNGTVEQQELSGLLEAEPDLHLEVDFGNAAPDSTPPAVRLKKMSDDLVAAGARANDRQGAIRIALTGSEIDVFAVQAAANSGSEPQVAGAKQPVYAALQMQALVGEVADPLFCWLDESRDNRLTSRELANSANRLRRLDEDGDGFLVAEEIPQRIELRFSRGTRSTSMPQFGSTPGPLGPKAAVPGWMAAMDQNADGEISKREFLGTSEKFAELDANDDGFIDDTEVK